MTIGTNLFEVVPEYDHKVCFQSTGSALATVLPDLTQGWEYVGNVKIQGWYAENWQLNMMDYNKSGVDNMFVVRDEAGNPRPILLILNSVDNIWGSHPDIYVMEYVTYVANFTMPTAFVIPQECNSAAEPRSTTTAIRRERLSRLSYAVNPYVDGEDADHVEFRQHCSKYNKVYSSVEEFEYRLSIYKANKKWIEQENAKNLGFTMAINHFGDMTDEEFVATMIPKRKRLGHRRHSCKHVIAEDADASVPDQINWVALGAVNPPPDQGVCGSCWTFGTAGSVEGVNFVKNGVLLQVSQQNIVDCAWGYSWSGQGGNLGCDGGYASGAMQWIIDNGGIALESTYPYLMQDGFCNPSDHSSGILLTGYINVTSGSEEALKVATAYAPVAIAIDAAHKHFRFYTAGVYYNPNCGNSLNDLDHEVLVAGYGTMNGQEYWYVRNNWSTYWGDEGYIYMARNRNNNCGIATQPNQPIIA